MSRHWLGDRIGRRGALLITLGVTYILVGLGALILEPTSTTLYLMLPSTLRALLWGLAGVAAIVFAWRQSDRVGWVALFVPPIIRGGAYVLSWAQGLENAWYQAIAGNAPFIAVVLICSGWREQRNIRKDGHA